MQSNGKIAVRQSLPGDRRLVLHSWQRCMRASPVWAECPDRVLYQELGRRLEELIERQGVTIWVAVPEGHPEVIAGWVCVESVGGRRVGHFCYVKFSYRRQGIAAMLMGKAGIIEGDFWSYWTPAGSKLARGRGLVFNPFLAGAGVRSRQVGADSGSGS